MRLKLTALALTLLCPLSAFAQDPAPPAPPVEAPAEPTPPPPPPAPPAPVAAPLAAPPAPPPPPAAPAPAGPTFKWEGLADTYYLYKFTGNSVNEAPGGRVFDTLGNTFNLGYAKLAMQADTDMFGFRIDFGYGNVGVVNNGLSLLGSKGSGSSAADGAATSLYGSAFFVQQAFATLKLGIATLDAGKFNTTAGAEVIESNKNWLYSRSFLFNAIPALHTGLRLTVKPTDILSLQLSLVNGGTSNNNPDNNGFKTIGLSVGLTPAPTTSIALTSYIGKDGAQNAEGDVTVLVDLVASQSFGDAFGLNLNFDYFKASGDSAYWYGVSLMGRYVIAPSFYLAARGEFVQAKGSYFASEKTSLEEGTLMAGIPFGPNYEIRLEGRGDFTNKDGIFFKGTTSKKNQVTGLAAFLAYF